MRCGPAPDPLQSAGGRSATWLAPGEGTLGVPGWLPIRGHAGREAAACCARASCELPPAGGSPAPGAEGVTNAGEEAEDGLAAELDAEEPPAVIDPSNALPWCSSEAANPNDDGTTCACVGREDREDEAVGEVLACFAGTGTRDAGAPSIAGLPCVTSVDERGQPNLVCDWDGLLQCSWLGEIIASSRATDFAWLGEETSDGSGCWRSVVVSSPPKPCSSSHFCRGDNSMALRCVKPAAGLERSMPDSKADVKRGVLKQGAGAITSTAGCITGGVTNSCTTSVTTEPPHCFEGDAGDCDGCGSEYKRP